MNAKNKNYKDLPEGLGNLNRTLTKTTEKAPDYFGEIMTAGVLYAVSGWRKISEKNNKFIALTVDEKDLENDVRDANRSIYLKEYKENKKSNKGNYLMMDHTGTLHIQHDLDKAEDLFGSLVINANTIPLHGFAAKSKQGNDYFRLKVTDGMRPKEQRSKSTNSLLA